MSNPADMNRNQNEYLVRFFPKDPGRVLDVGCGTGEGADRYRLLGASEVIGVELVPEKAKLAAHKLDKVYCDNIELMELPFEPGSFDTIVCSDIIEHLFNPWGTMRRLAALLANTGTLLASVPNLANYTILLNILGGSFPYTEWGLLDRKHLRFFTIDDMAEMLEDAGLHPEVLTYSVTPEAEKLLGIIDGDQIRFAVQSLFKALNPELNPASLEALDPILFYVYEYFIKATKKY